MFGSQDDALAPQGGGTSAAADDTLNGVADLVGGTAIPPGGAPADDSAPADAVPPASGPVEATLPAPEEEKEETPTPGPAPQITTSPANDDLLDLKQQALQQLSPLVSQLDQSPEEKFRTLMMMIQASDNQGLLKEAYETAQAIEDEKTKAQALLDVINEINYFTQSKQQG